METADWCARKPGKKMREMTEQILLWILPTLKTTLSGEDVFEQDKSDSHSPWRRIIHGWYKITMVDDDDYLWLLVLKTGTS